MPEHRHPDFDEAFNDAIDAIPQELLNRLDNVVFEFSQEPTPEQQAIACGGELMGLYRGVPLPQRSFGYGAGMTMPDQIWIFIGPIMRVSAGSHQAAVERIRQVVLHEIGHYFGMDDAALHALGY